MHTLRARLILSHILPLLVIILLTGIALDYVLETQFLLPSIAGELTDEALLVAEIAAEQPALWDDPAQAQTFVDRVGPRLRARAMLLDAEGQLLASTDPADAEYAGGLPQGILDLDEVLAGEVNVHTVYSQRQQSEVVDVLVPVWGADQQVIGVVRLTRRLAAVYEQFLRLRHLIAGVMALGLILGAAVAWMLALNLGRSLQQVTRAVHRLAGGERFEPLPEQGPDEIRLLLRAVNTLVERTQALEQARRQLLANLVHELGRPLGALRSAIQALQGGADEDPALSQELLVGMDDEISRLQRLLDDLAQLHDQVLGARELQLQPVSLSQWLPEVLGAWRGAALGKGLHWQVTIPTTLPTLEVDCDRLGQALGNLLSNAVRYTSEDGTVSVAAGVEDRAVWIRVSDTGPGIAPEEQAHVFKPLYRGSTGRRFPMGMGLGLSIARDLVVAHGGRLEMTSTPGQGSHFMVWLPLNPYEQ